MAVGVQLQSIDYEETKFAYQHTKQLNNLTLFSQLEIILSLFNSRYIDEALLLKFDFSLGLDYNPEQLRFEKDQIVIKNHRLKIYESTMLTLMTTREC
jgi:hypothetical protein